MLKKQNEKIGEIRVLREDLKEMLNKRLVILERDMAQVKVKLGIM
ncbi:MAG: hypothetical protein ACUVTL_10475 [Thermoproteota archaeon]